MLALHDAVGNRGVNRLIGSGMVRPKLKVNQLGDRYEQEADRVAAAVMRMPEPAAAGRSVRGQGRGGVIQRMCPKCEEELPLQQSVSAKPMTVGGLRVQRLCHECGQELRWQSTETGQTPPAQGRAGAAREPTPPLASGIAGPRGGGQPLPESVRQYFEPRFGCDFSHVRIHTDSQAGESAQEINALAYTVGHDIVFGPGQYAPSSTAGHRLLAHELVHTLQQGGLTTGGGVSAVASPVHGRSSDGLEARVGGPAAIHRLQSPVAQRATNIRGGTFNRVVDLARQLAAGQPIAGSTIPHLNGTPLLQAGTLLRRGSDTVADVITRAGNAMNAPNIVHSSTATGTECRVESVPLNELDFDLRAPTAGPWMILMPKRNLRTSVLSNHPHRQCDRSGDTIFQVNGLPFDERFAQEVMVHEAIHALDAMSLFILTIVPWDAGLEVARAFSVIFHGTNRADCEAKLFQNMDFGLSRVTGTPSEIGQSWMLSVLRAAALRHLTPLMEGFLIINPRAEQSNCILSEVDVMHRFSPFLSPAPP